MITYSQFIAFLDELGYEYSVKHNPETKRVRVEDAFPTFAVSAFYKLEAFQDFDVNPKTDSWTAENEDQTILAHYSSNKKLFRVTFF